MRVLLEPSGFQIKQGKVLELVYSSEEIEDRLVLEIYKVLVASGRDISSLQN